MGLESAELAKISINMCLVASIGVANTMAGICETVGADWSEIVPALKLDTRIGPSAYLKPGLGLAEEIWSGILRPSSSWLKPMNAITASSMPGLQQRHSQKLDVRDAEGSGPRLRSEGPHRRSRPGV